MKINSLNLINAIIKVILAILIIETLMVATAALYHVRPEDYDIILALCVNIFATVILSGMLIVTSKKSTSHNMLKALQGDNTQAKDSLSEELQNYLKERDLMLSALAHDIKTPLTEARLRLEFIEDQHTANLIKEKLDLIHKIVHSSLEFAREPANVKKVSADIVSLIETVVEDYKDGVFDISFTTNIDHLEMNVEIALFKRLLMNLIDNAKKYANNARIILELHPDSVHLICEDDGPGVPEKFLPLLTVPYFRMDQSRSRNTGGTGLGLAIVKKIAEIHDAQTIMETPTTGQGFRVVIKFNLPTRKR